jgi:hypothetical protein
MKSLNPSRDAWREFGSRVTPLGTVRCGACGEILPTVRAFIEHRVGPLGRRQCRPVFRLVPKS